MHAPSQLNAELAALRQRVAELEARKAGRQRTAQVQAARFWSHPPGRVVPAVGRVGQSRRARRRGGIGYPGGGRI